MAARPQPAVEAVLAAVRQLKAARGRQNTEQALAAASSAFAEARAQQLVNPRLVHLFFPAKQPMFVE